MNKRFLPLLLISSFAFSQVNVEQPAEPIITDLDRLVESVKKTASSRSAEDNARLQRFLADKNRQQFLLNQMKAKLNAEEDRSVRLTKEYEDNDSRLADLEEQLTLKLGSFGELFGIVRQTAGESKGQFSLSLTNIEYPERIEFLGDIAERKSLDLPTNEELERLWFEILNRRKKKKKKKEK
jgi:biopolymer transport protein ExbB